MKDRVLVVDDEGGVRASLAGILGDEGYAVEAVDTGEAALAALESQRYDLVLLDVWLPGQDGLLAADGFTDLLGGAAALERPRAD